jgi:hypothetical protein
VGPVVLGGLAAWALEDAPEVLRFLRDFAPQAPDELGVTLAMMLAPPAPFLPPAQVGKPVLILVLAWAGDLDDGEKATAPLRRLGRPIAELVRPVPYLALQSALDGGAPTAGRPPTAGAWPGWSRSRTATTPTTCSG